MDSTTCPGGNSRFAEEITQRNGATDSLESLPHTDFGIDQERARLNGVAVNLQCFQSSNAFRLMRERQKIKLK